MAPWGRRDVSEDRLLAEELGLLEVTESLAHCMEERDISRAEMARRLGVSRSEMTQRLNGSRNLTVKSVAAMFDALGYRMRVTPEDRFASGHRVRLGSREHLTAFAWDDDVDDAYGPSRTTETGVTLRLRRTAA